MFTGLNIFWRGIASMNIKSTNYIAEELCSPDRRWHIVVADDIYIPGFCLKTLPQLRKMQVNVADPRSICTLAS